MSYTIKVSTEPFDTIEYPFKIEIEQNDSERMEHSIYTVYLEKIEAIQLYTDLGIAIATVIKSDGG